MAVAVAGKCSEALAAMSAAATADRIVSRHPDSMLTRGTIRAPPMTSTRETRVL